MSVASAGRGHVNVLIADSRQTPSDLLDSALRRQPGLKISRCLSEIPECLQALRSTPIDVMLLSSSFPDHDRLLNALRVLHSSHSDVRVVLLLDGYDRDLVVNAMRAGARGLFDRAKQSFRALCRCITVVHAGQIWVDAEQLGYIVEAIGSVPPQHRVVSARGEVLLTPREEQVVSLVADGVGNRAIAEQLGIKENTVKKSLMRIYDKLGVCNRVELVLYALTHRAMEQATTVSAASADPFAIECAGSSASTTLESKVN